jgi:uncharacterized protein YkuJ
MKKQINEIKRMQQLAGLINESTLNEDNGLLPMTKSEEEDGEKVVSIDYNNVVKNIKNHKSLIAKR